MIKKIVLTIGLLVLAVIITEYSNIFGLAAPNPNLYIYMIDNTYVITWSKIPYPAYYQLEAFTEPPEPGEPAPPPQQLAVYRTFKNSFTVNNHFPFQTFWRVSANGLFKRPIGSHSSAALLPEVNGSKGSFAGIKPIPISPVSPEISVSVKPMLIWIPVPGAVTYEIEFLKEPPENPNGIEPSIHGIGISREVFTNGYNADFSHYPDTRFYWRVRALDENGGPLGAFSDVAELRVDRSLPVILKPIIFRPNHKEGAPPPLYPAYAWIPIQGAVSYEVELTRLPPENPNGIHPSKYRIWSKQSVNIDCYDDHPRIEPGTYFWRVRALDATGQTVGKFSDVSTFTVDHSKGTYAATFGDSITHGGGAISYSPADWEYSFQSYLDFPVVNLGKSGDTAEAMLARFEADVLPFRPQYLIILGGTNSLRGGVPAGQVISDLSKIRNKCIDYGIRPIFLTLPPINPAAIEHAFKEETAPNWRAEFAAVNAFIRQQQYYIDLEPYFSDPKGELPKGFAIDGLHPDIEGKKLMAQIINAHWKRVTR